MHTPAADEFREVPDPIFALHYPCLKINIIPFNFKEKKDEVKDIFKSTKPRR
jgi:hypothetical protein